MKKNILKWSPWIVIVLGILISAGLVMSKSKPERKEKPARKIPVVRVETLHPQPYQIEIEAYGTTEPSQELALGPQISGRVLWFAPELVEGGFVEKDQLLFRLDPVDAELQVEQAKAALAKAEFDLENVTAQKESSIAGYKGFIKAEELKDRKKFKMSPLASFTPQLKNARAALDSAKANLKQTELNLSRTYVRAPFSGYLRQVKIANGQILNANQTVAQLFSDRPIRLKVSLPLSDMPWIEFRTRDHNGSEVILQKEMGPEVHKWKGEAVRLLKEIDSLGRMAQVMVEVNEPESDGGFSLPLNLHLNIKILGKTLDSAYRLPLHALRDENKIWLVKEENRLEIRPVKVLRKEKESILITDNMIPGEKVVVSPMEAAIDGMPVKIFGDQTEAPKRQKDQK